MHVTTTTARFLDWGRTRRAAHIAAVFALCVIVAPVPLGANGERTIALYNVHTKETLRIVYKRNGRYIKNALGKLNWHLRDWRQNEPTKMDPALIDLVWEIHAELGSRAPVHVISGYRSPKTNRMLRKTRGGQARRSQHLLGRALDVRFPDIPVRRLRYSALLREQGGVGYYPTSATPFVHVDTGRVRHWPRMGRQELALLFPHGRTRHRPRRGGPITRSDALTAQKNNPTLARRVALFHDQRRSGPSAAGPRTRFAAAPRPQAAPVPRLIEQPRAAQRPAGDATPRPFEPRVALASGGWLPTLRRSPRARVEAERRPPRIIPPKPRPYRALVPPAISSSDRSRLAHLARAELKTPLGPGMEPTVRQRSRHVAPAKPDEWIRAPAYDEEHPEELFYRPFPIAPYITQTASADDPALQQLTHPDIDKTLALLVPDGADDLTLQMRPGRQTANLWWSQSFSAAHQTGRSVTAAPDPRTALGRRLVRIAGR